MIHLRKALPLLALGLGLGCGGASQTGQGAGPTGPVSTQQRIVNINPVDLGVCFQQAPALPEKINSEVLTGLLVAARPFVMECLVDPKNRGPADETDLALKTTLSGGKLAHAITGQNITPAGEQCIKAAVDKFTATAPDWEKKAGAASNVTAEVQYKHIASVMPSVKMGVGEGSDVAGTIRLAQGSFCDCYAPWKSADPVVLTAQVKLTQAGAPAVTIKPPTDPNGTQVATCLQPKVAALPLKTTSTELTVPYTFMFLSSAKDGLFQGAPPPIAFAQYELARNQRLAAGVIAMGARTQAAEAYDALVNKYKKDTASVTVEQLKNGCAALTQADDAYLAALQKQLELEQSAVAMFTDFAGKDAAWVPVKDATQGNVDVTKKDIENGKKFKEADLAACPKVK
ncbi:hypothetical protein [Polyangium sp. 15x6]|uniref:hypothetical protein n=1 Tax=Polyangium sp. 15x6 TaxID=3042687 RepID=UPI00249A87CA|nr:hypothetical protein [Polyangium sp. 15x6]MDI3289742.1 hypothetical protein [Polyangium sp. 15x6]